MLIISNNTSKIMALFSSIVIVIFLCVIAYLYLHKDEDFVSKHYINYMAIPEGDGVFTWLPDFFPTTAMDISIYTNVENNYFFSYFTLTKDDGKRFKKTLTLKATKEVAKTVSDNDKNIKNVWCKYGKIPDQGNDINLFFVGEIDFTHYFITNIGAKSPEVCVE